MSVFYSVMGTVAREWMEKEYSSYFDQEHANCPVCGRWLKRQDVCQRTLETMIGEITIHRPYFYCSVCHHGFYPLDDALNLSYRRKQYDVQEAATDLAKEVPYEKASYMVWVMPTGTPPNDNTRVIERDWHNPTMQIGPTDYTISELKSDIKYMEAGQECPAYRR